MFNSLYSYSFIYILPSEMIKVHAVFPRKEGNQKEIAIQTDILPKIGWHGSKPSKFTHSPKQETIEGKVSSLRTTKQRWFCDGRLSSIGIIANSPNVAKKYPRSRKENACINAQSSKIQAKAFKFLKFQEDLVRSSILKHLDGRQQSKQQRRKMREKVDFLFLSIDTTSKQKEYNDDFGIIEIPQEQHISTTIQDLVDAVRKTYEDLQICQKGRDVIQTAVHKKIAQVVQSLIAQGSRPIHQPFISNWDKDNILKNYLKRYVGKIQSKSHIFNSTQNKHKLLGFYQDIYNRYEAVPFCEDNEQTIIVPTEVPPQFMLKSPTSTVSRGKSSANSDESFIKLRFYNNLRKEVQSLSEDTEKIMAEQSNKLDHC